MAEPQDPSIEASDLLREALRPGVGPASLEGAAALVPGEAVAMAVLGPRDAVAFAEPRFLEAFPHIEVMPQARRLTASARRNGAALGVLETREGAIAPVWTATGARARAWTSDPPAQRALDAEGSVLLLMFAPSRSDALARAAIDAFGLAPLEARLAEAFLFAPTLEIAAEQIGVGRETARDAMGRIMAKLRVRRSVEVVLRLTELMSAVRDQAAPTLDVLVDGLGLTRAEAEVAARLILGATQKEVAEALGLKAETVRGYAKAALAKTGASRVKDLARVATEAQALSGLVAVSEPVLVSGGSRARLLLRPAPDGRKIALLDYGPRSGRPAVIFHGFVAGRSLPPALVAGLHRQGVRPIVVQRPGFGLSSPATGGYLETAARDLAAVVDDLDLQHVRLFARDGGVAAALAFAAAHPALIARGVLLNPRSPRGLGPGQRGGPVARLTRLLLANPHLIGAFGEFIRRRTRSDLIAGFLRDTLRALPQDLAALDDPAVLAQLVRDIQAQFSHSCAGYVAEHALYARGWTPPRIEGGGPWTILHSGALTDRSPPREPWRELPGVSFLTLDRAGVLAQFTHAQAIAALIAG